MSIENVKLLFEKLAEDESLKNQLKDLHQKMGEEILQEILILGEKQGIHFTKEEFYAYTAEVIKQSQCENELSDEELQGVAGGLSGWPVYSVLTVGIVCASSMVLKGMYGNDHPCIADQDVL